ncbi:glycosyltransferase family 2 protein [Gordonia polyisoprenivorans]|uniref:glycosyltransferase family 2 protein n=1 Tax=Gordonia polyisoprenivorans TaxID=84595 RepID=UPI001AD7595D|nr:glycosyltransferase family 2 protein [Gordonia polyisoprenivorans]QTI70121.1 glycosyltransferase family 2 protein [Gordonia polyisoprenivorans]
MISETTTRAVRDGAHADRVELLPQDDGRVLLSVVIPVFNEADTIGTCLDLLIDQIDDIAEIIVVDNNSTDATREIVEERTRRTPRIRVVDESTQGLVHARNAGMDSATGDVIARIDADTRIPAGWARTIVEFFEADSQGQWSALCGRGAAYGLPFEGSMSRIVRLLRPVARRLSRERASAQESSEAREIPVLYGSNMVVRREVWQVIRTRVSMRRDIFEDVDMGLCVQDINGRNAFLASLTVGVSPRRMETGVSAFAEYMSFLPRTLLLHRRYGLAAGAAFGYLPPVIIVHAARLVLIRAYDADAGTFSVRNLLRSTTERGLP